MTVHPDYKEFVASLNVNRVKYLIVGAHALGFHGIPRYTKDIDFWIELSKKNILCFLKTLRDFFGTDFNLLEKDFKKGVILQLGVEPVRIDILTFIQGLTFKKVWRRRIRSRYGCEPANYLSLNDLVRAKKSAGRKQDLIDLERLSHIMRGREHMKRIGSVITILFILGVVFSFTNIAGAQEKKLRIAVVEFELRGEDIGLKDAAKIIPEMLITELEKLKKYDIEERLLLTKVLEEQKLGLSGLIEQSTAAKVGELFGVDAVVAGTAMKVADEITVNARIISTSTGQVISSGIVKFTKIKQIKDQIEILANELCGISPDQLKERKEIEERQRSRYCIDWGLLFGFDAQRFGVSPTYIGISFESRLMDIYFAGSPPVVFGDCSFGGMQFGASFNITPYIGLGAEWEYSSLSSPAGQNPPVGTMDLECYGAGIGIKFRPLTNLSARIVMGMIYQGKVQGKVETSSTDWGSYEIIPQFKLPPNLINISVEYRLNETFGLRWMFMMRSGEYLYKGTSKWIGVTYTGLAANYSFTLAKRK